MPFFNTEFAQNWFLCLACYLLMKKIKTISCALIFLLASAFAKAQQAKDINYYLASAISRSPLLNDYNNQAYNLRLDSLSFLANYGFYVSGEGSASYAPAVKGWGYDNALSNGHPVTAVLRVTRPLLGKTNLNTRLAGYYLSIQQVHNQARLSEMQLKKNITDFYIATYVSQEQYKVTQHILHIFSQEDLVLKKLTQASVFKQTDYLSFKVNQQQNELMLEQKRAEWYNNYAQLNYAAGIIDTVPKQLLQPSIDTAILPFDESIYAQAFRADSMKLANDAKIIGYEYKPKINAYADAGYQSTLTQTPYKNFGWSTGISVSIPIYDGKKKQLALRQNQNALETRTKYLDFARSQYIQQVAQVKSQLGQYYKMVATANEQLKYANTLIEANAKQLPTGDVKMVDFILSVSNYHSLKLGLLQYQGTIFTLQNQLHYLMLP